MGKYTVEIKPGVFIEVTCPAIAHAIKKLLVPGERGAKDKITDLKEAVESIQRAIELTERPEETPSVGRCKYFAPGVDPENDALTVRCIDVRNTSGAVENCLPSACPLAGPRDISGWQDAIAGRFNS